MISPEANLPPQLIKSDEVILLPGASQPLITAAANHGKGTWIYRLGDNQTADKSIKLDVPYLNQNATEYETTLAWQLCAVPPR